MVDYQSKRQKILTADRCRNRVFFEVGAISHPSFNIIPPLLELLRRPWDGNDDDLLLGIADIGQASKSYDNTNNDSRLKMFILSRVIK